MSKISLFDSFTHQKKTFTPLTPGKVGIYTCGPTVYDYPHIGNLRAYVFSDTLRKILEYNGLNVKHVMNITDVGHLTSDADEGEDKIEMRASQTGKSAWDVSKFFIEVFVADLEKLNILAPTILCRATDYIKEQIILVQKLEKLGYTYRTSDGIYYDISKFLDYGIMANLKKQRLRAGARVEVNPEKRNPADFALWKFSSPAKKRQMEWDSPWGMGFPGWHIECSAMALHFLGPTLDIHTGGIDHLTVHHPNEIAQSEAVTGEKFARYWMHSNFLRVDGKKMSKSFGNLFTLDDIISKGIEPLAFRYLLLTSHYSRGLNFTWDGLKATQVALNTVRLQIGTWPDGGEVNNIYREKFEKSVNDDLNTPRGIAILWDVIKSKIPAQDKKATILDFDRVLGLRLKESLIKSSGTDVPNQIHNLAKKREQFRKEKKWAEADSIRQEIQNLGYSIEDTPEGIRFKQNS